MNQSSTIAPVLKTTCVTDGTVFYTCGGSFEFAASNLVNVKAGGRTEYIIL